MRLFSLRRLLGVSMLLLALVPALLATWLLARASDRAAQELAGGILFHVAARVQSGTEAHLAQAQNVLNALFPENMSAAQQDQARDWLRGSAAFEPMAFALTRQSSGVPSLYWGNRRGEYFSVETAPDGVLVRQRSAGDAGRRSYLAKRPGDRSQSLPMEAVNFEPRTRSWYQGAMMAKGRGFSPILQVPGKSQLYMSLSQPVYESDGGAAGVFGVDIYLQQLADLLRTQSISARGAAFIVDEAGKLVASSAGDPLFLDAVADRVQRRGPQDSANPAIRQSYVALQAERARKRDDSVAVSSALQRLPMGNDTLMMVQRPFGQALGLRWTLVVAAPESDFTGEINNAWRVSLGVIAALVLLAALTATLIARSLGRRLQTLSKAAQSLGSGEVPEIDKTTRVLEVRQLSQVLHDSAGQLKGYREQVAADAQALRQANETLETRVALRTAELEASREEALAAVRAKAAFLATMSHEIRTPLNGVVGMSTLLAETRLDAEQRDYLQTIRLSSDQLLAVISDILDFSKIESGKLELEAEPLSVRGMVEEACDIAAPRAREKGLELIIDIPEPRISGVPGAVRSDATRLKQVLINLINNAVKFTEKGEVSIHARRLPQADAQGLAVIEFRVTDTGIGIPPERVGSLFQAFTQVDASTTRKYGGTGLGLAICKRLVELMGGHIGVESELGKGSSFWFTVAAPETEMAPTFSHAEVGVLKGNRVLIVDDHATNVRILMRQLQLWGMEVASAESGAQALRWLEQASREIGPKGDAWMPDVIITDMHMPEMDGVTLARMIKAQARWRDIPLVLLSSGFMPASNDSGQLFDARLLKPARQTHLFDTIAHCISSEYRLREPAPTITDAKKHITVLVADDNAVNLKVACAMLLKLGYDIQTAIDGRGAVDAVAQAMAQGRRFGAILMDVNMPGLDGLEATREIQAEWGSAAPPIIALTAAASSEDRVRCEAAGMNDYLTKPLHVAALAVTLEKWLPTGQALPEVPALAVGAAVPAGNEEALLIDMSRLNEFKEFDDEALTMTREVVALFIEDAPHRLQAVEEAVVAGDALALSRAAHALKGAAGNIGAAAVQALATALEADAQHGVPPDAQARLDRLRELLTRTREALDDWT
ncbi:MAG: response regulator [Burkholderiaceae bacterium]|nr:response regulator [Burkholderiaceae bacterium]MDO9090750.1 response regulator [Burkholderiaceae bacterium]